MTPEQDYITINRALWDEKTIHHLNSEFYNMRDGSFIESVESLNDIELALLGDVKDKEVLHLQCHFGQDTLSLAKLGAIATGVDFSGAAIDAARKLNEQLELSATFIHSDIYELPQTLNKQFDIVFASYGTIGWLPDMRQWAQVVAHCLKPGGRFVFVEFHPVVWMFNYDFNAVTYSYFNREAIVETATTTYADRTTPINMQEIGWNHSLAEVMQSLMDAGLHIDSFGEHDFSPYNCFKNMREVAPGRFQVAGLEGRLPLLYALTASFPKSKKQL